MLMNAKWVPDENPQAASVGLVTVEPHHEHQALCRVLGLEDRPPTVRVGGIGFWFFELQVGTNVLTVVSTNVGRAGNLNAEQATRNLIELAKPDYVALVGIAGGIRGKVELADVVIANRVIYTAPGKALPAGEKERRFDNVEQPGPESAEQLVNALKRIHWADAFHMAEGRLADEGRTRPSVALTPKLVAAAVASGEEVVEDESPETLRKEYDGRIRAVEMEGAGFVRAANAAGVKWKLFRGISDFADAKSRGSGEKDKYHDSAANAAAAACAAWLRHLMQGGTRELDGDLTHVNRKPWEIDGAPLQLARLAEPSFWTRRACADGVLSFKAILPSGRFHGATGQLPLVSDAMFLGDIASKLAALHTPLRFEATFDIDVVQHHNRNGYRLQEDLLKDHNLIVSATGDINIVTRLLYERHLPGLVPGPTAPSAESIAGLQQAYPNAMHPFVGMLAVMRSPFNPDRVLIVTCGALAAGTLGAQRLLAAYIDGEARQFGNNEHNQHVPAKIVDFSLKHYNIPLTDHQRDTPRMDLRNIDLTDLRRRKGVLE